MLFRVAGLSLVCIAVWSTSGLAQLAEVPTQESLPTLDQINSLIQEVDASSDLDDLKKASIRQLYQQAAASLESIAKSTEDLARFDSMITNAARTLSEVTEKIDGLPKSSTPIEGELSLTQLQQQLAAAEAEVLRSREQLSQLNSDVAARQVRQREVPLQLETARSQLADTNRQLATTAPENEHPLLTRARQTLLRVQAAALTSQIAALEKELPAYAATTDLLPKQRDLAGQTLSLAEATQQALLSRIDQLRREEVSSQVDQALRVLEQTSDVLKPLAQTTLDYATENQAILQQLKETAIARSDTERILGSVKQEFQRTREKVETVGLTDSLGIFLRSKRNDLAVLRGQHHPDRTRRGTVQGLQLRLLQFEDTRSELTQLDVVLETRLAELLVETADSKLRSQARKLLESQRDSLDSLLQNQRTYFESLVAFDSAERELIQQIDEYAVYIEGWILWVRSVPPLGVADVENTLDAVKWLARPAEWGEIARTAIAGVQRRLFATIVFAVAFIALAFRQRHFRRRLQELGSQAEPRRCRDFRITVEAAILTALIAAVWPTLLFFTGWQLGSDPSSSLSAQALGWAFVSAGAFLLLVESTRQILRLKGLAQSHFSWPEKTRRSFSRQLRWFSLTTLLVFVVVFLRSQPNEQFHHSLGRLSFLALMACSSFLAFRTLRPSGAMFVELGERAPTGWGFRLRSFVFVTAFGMPGLLFILAATGYYYSAYQLAQRLMETVALAVMLVTVTGLLLRWILIHRRRLTFEQKIAARQRAVLTESGDSPKEFIDEAESAVDLVEVTRQTLELVRVLVVVVAFLSGWWIWNDVLPALEFLASVEVWRINLPNRIEIITLKHLFSCGLTMGLTFVAVKNVPGLLELLFLQRLPLDAGARYAVTTIARYALAVLGVIIGFSFIHIEWSQYGWIVAAATVGLGFGLQEIFANFVSGLIVLLERPIRVGDVVTVDGITGVVQRIHMRATVLRNWDHQELIVPNKEFVTTKLLNWTLSNATNRVVINVGIAYGSDTERAREIMRQVVAEHSNVLDDPVPSVTFEQFGDSTLNFIIRCYIPQLDGRLATIHELNTQINTRLQAAGIEIAFPQRDLHLRTVPPGWPTMQGTAPKLRGSESEK
ncbi:MAG: mechanosensitive ion channel [Planctomycetaceae bacterium]|nr:mechanosensitive ion channel [Planctomycetales bacterium]MCB9875689.1 mechanosensitive ion channel [Planctomycetaceae bacterium]MCB9940882.1 mechanosensitive ion channel [Planctomycetaceae bacterium]